MTQFFSMPRGDLLFMVTIMLIGAASMSPWATSQTWNGMAVQGWMLAGLMILAPSAALLRLALERPRGESNRE